MVPMSFKDGFGIAVLLAFAVAMCCGYLVPRNIDRGKLLTHNEPEKLFGRPFPPREVLTKRGRMILTIMWAAIGTAIMLLLAYFGFGLNE